MSQITIIGLGPGDPDLITRTAWEYLQAASELYVRTRQHPTVAALPGSLVVHSFDAVYDAGEDFAAVYGHIAEQVIALGRRPQGVLYAVPGDPAVGEATTWLIRRQAQAEGLTLQIVHGVSFLEPACLALSLDPLERDGLQVVDAMVVAAGHAPPFDTSRPALLAQCYSRALASEVKLTLMHSYGDEHRVTVLRNLGLPEQELLELPLFELDRQPLFDHLTTLYVPPLGSLAAHSRLQEIVAHLRAPDGCPWDRQQTLQSLRKDLLEETYEVLEALDADDDDKLREELGDLSLLIAMLAQIASEEERFKWPQVMAQINEKLIRRHPHVFGDVEVSGAEEVLANWARIKEEEAREKGQERGQQGPSLLDSVPRALPALALASKYQSRLERAGIEPDLAGVDGIGLRLWELVAQARAAGVDAETALREVCLRVARSLEDEPRR